MVTMYHSKKMSIIDFDRPALESVKDEIISMAESEHLTAHANSIAVRFEKKED